MNLTDKPSCYVFQGVLPICIENRHINTKIEKGSRDLILTQFLSRSEGTSEEIQQTIPLPGEITNQRIIGQPVCIGCRQELYVFQFISVSVNHIQFFSVDITNKTVKLFKDSVCYFRKDIAKISPIECHISPSKDIIILRLPQSVLKLNKQSNILLIKNEDTCFITKAKLLDKKHTSVIFHPVQPQTLLMVQVNDISSKCNLKLYNMAQQEVISHNDCNINTFSFDSTNQDEDQDAINEWDEDVESRVMSLWHTSTVFNRTSDLILLTCIPVVQTFVTVYGFDVGNLQLKFSNRIITNIKQTLSVADLVTTEISMCNTVLKIHQHVKFVENSKHMICSCKLPVVLNLKHQIRSSIWKNFSEDKLEEMIKSLPKQLQSFMYLADVRHE